MGYSEEVDYGVFLRLANGDSLKKQLWSIVTNQEKSMTHAWVFTGPPGSGRSVAAKVFAAALLCENPDKPGCGECKACKAVFAGTHSDLFYVNPEGLSISVATVRSVIKQASLAPVSGDWRIVIVEDADRLTEGAANAFLKTVEEPPARTVIILCTPSLDPQDLIITLRSRCRHVYVPTPSPQDIQDLLRREFPDRDMADIELASSVTCGHIGRARAFLKYPEVRARRQEIFDLIASLPQGDRAFRRASTFVDSIKNYVGVLVEEKEESEKAKLRESFGENSAQGFRSDAQMTASSATALKELEENHKRRRVRMSRDLLDLALTDIAAFFRDVLYVHACDQDAIINTDQRVMIDNLVRLIDEKGCLEAIDAAMYSRELLSYNVAPDLVLASLVGRLRLITAVQ